MEPPDFFLSNAREAAAEGNADAALTALISGYQRLLADDSPVRRLPVGWPEADALCAAVGRKIASAPPAIPENRDVIIATQVYAGGGHTAVIGDIVRHSSSAEKVVLLTQTIEAGIHKGGRPKAEILARMGIPDEHLRICQETSPAAILHWLAAELQTLRPRRTFLFHHPQDAPAIAATRTGLAGTCYLVHHSDRTPCAGLYAPGVQLADLSPYTAGFSVRVLGLDPACLPLTVDDHCGPERPPVLSGHGGRLTTVSSGSAEKFGPAYPEITARILSLTEGTHHHIGKLSAAQITAISAALAGAGISTDHFCYRPWVPSLAAAFRDIRADLCIGSAPLGGARTAIEACAAGVPMLAHHPETSTRFGVTHVLPDSLLVWKTPDELLALVAAVDRPWLESQSRIAREFYETRHHPDILRRALREIDCGGARIGQSLAAHPLEEFVDAAALGPRLTGEWAFLRSSVLRA